MGLDKGDNVVSRLWKIPKISPAKPDSRHQNWLDSIDRSITSFVQVFCKKYDCPKWKESLKTSIYWYLTAAGSNSAENWTVTSQIAFELLGWTYFVNDKKALCEDGYKSMQAANKLRLLMSMLNIDLQVPTQLKELKLHNKKDGPETITNIRNIYVHPNKEKQQVLDQYGHGWRYEGSQLSAEYLELILLAIVGYEEKYWSRCQGNYVSVPWGR